MKKRLLWMTLAMALPFQAHAATVYLCRAYSGGMFWSNKHCNQQSASIIRIANVPDGMSWDNQVALAEQQRSEGEALVAPPRRNPSAQSSTTTNVRVDKRSQCAALDQRINDLDALARQGQSGTSQQSIREQRQTARDQQFRLGC
jgi:hypothetical protein